MSERHDMRKMLRMDRKMQMMLWAVQNEKLYIILDVIKCRINGSNLDEHPGICPVIKHHIILSAQ